MISIIIIMTSYRSDMFTAIAMFTRWGCCFGQQVDNGYAISAMHSSRRINSFAPKSASNQWIFTRWQLWKRKFIEYELRRTREKLIPRIRNVFVANEEKKTTKIKKLAIQ